ncbi:MAG: transposase [Solirubrobacteraceae bacterium]
MAIGHARSGEQTRQVEMVCVDDLVPPGDLYRRIEALVEWGAVRASAAPFYGDQGRPSVDPVVLVKVFLVAAVEGFGSMRQTLRMAERDLSIRRFLGYGLSEQLPHHATLSYANCVRFAGSSVFEQLFTQVLCQCRERGLVGGSRLVVDATHVEAAAALKSLRAELAAVEDCGGDAAPEPEPEPEPERPRLALAEPRSGPTPRRKASNASVVSLTDRDAKLRHKPGQRPHLVHRAQVATDPKARVIVAVEAEPATGHEGEALGSIIDRARWARHAATEVCADQGYASDATYRALAAKGVTAFIPPQRQMLGLEPAQAARARCKSPPGIGAAIDRMTHAEGAISELKLRHGLDRARCAGTPKLQVQLLLAATAVNLKRLTSHPPAATSGQTGDASAIHHCLQTITTCLAWLHSHDQTSSLTGS